MRFVAPVQVMFGALAVFFLLLYLFPRPHPVAGDVTQSQTLGLFLLFVAVNAWCILYWLFYLLRLQKLPAPASLSDARAQIEKGIEFNEADFLDMEAARLVYKMIIFARKHNIAVSAMCALFILLKSRRAEFIFSRLLISKAEFEKSVEVIVHSQFARTQDERILGPEFSRLMRAALADAAERRAPFIGFSNLFYAAVSADKTIQRLLFDFGVRKEDVFQVLKWEEEHHKEYGSPKPFLANFSRVQGLADDWAYGYTPLLDAYGKEMAVHSIESEAHMHILARDEEIGEVEAILARSGKNNVVLVGESGTGKSAVAQGFAQRVFEGAAVPELAHKRVILLDANKALSRAKDSAGAVALFDRILSEALGAGNVILVVDNIHTLVGAQRKEEVGAADISSVLIPYLQSERFQMIALTDHGSYHSQIERVPSLATLFEKVEVREFDEEKTLRILEDITPRIERRQRVFISYWALAEAVSASGSFIQNVPFPEKAISLLTETISFVSSHKLFGSVVTQDHVTEVISKKTGIPLGRIEGEEKAKLLNLETLLHQRIIAQNEAIAQIAAALRRIRSGIGERKRPIGTFLFLGPTGVGKTETAKALAGVYFGAEERMVRLDMTEYQNADSLHRLIGNVDTDTPAQFANTVRENPFSIVVLDELEKSHPNVQNLFLQVLDEGRLTDAFQKKVSFRNAIIIATSNAGSEFIREYARTGQNKGVVQMRLVEHLLKNNIFKPEFLNRFDAVIVFAPLLLEEIAQIAGLMISGLRARLEKKGFELRYDNEALSAIAQKGYSSDFGARELRRYIEETVENKIADKIIKGEYRQGDIIPLAELM